MPSNRAVGAASGGRNRRVRSHIDTETDRVALESPAVNSTRRYSAQSGRGARLQQVPAVRADLPGSVWPIRHGISIQWPEASAGRRMDAASVVGPELRLVSAV